jgi:hypothetical protein
VPKLPTHFQKIVRSIPEDQGRRWTAARCHVSQISQWSEDIHTAASEAWQATESFVGGEDHIDGRLMWTSILTRYRSSYSNS